MLIEVRVAEILGCHYDTSLGTGVDTKDLIMRMHNAKGDPGITPVTD